MPSVSQLEGFVSALAELPSTHDCANPYASNEQGDGAIRCANLLRYLTHMASHPSPYFLLMEAPGYRGCRVTGIPVTSRKIMLDGVPELGLFGKEQGYQNSADVGFERVWSEQSATIVWSTLVEQGVSPLIWNSLPLHPHQLNSPLSNRSPRPSEITLGATYVARILDLFAPQTLIAVGKVADSVLTHLELPHEAIRHPAQGGKGEFVQGLARIFQR